MNTSVNVRKLTITAAGTAIVFLFTRVIQISIPLGYANFGSVVIFVLSALFGPAVGGIAGALGSALSDLTSYPIWALPTLVVRGLMGVLPGLCARWHLMRTFRASGGSGATNQLTSPAPGSLSRPGLMIGIALAAVASVVGYTLFGALLYHSLAAGLSSAPGLIAEQAANVALFPVLYTILKKAGITS